MAISIVQRADNEAGATSPMALAFGSNVVSGNLLVVTTMHSYAGCAISISDTRGSTFTKRVDVIDISQGGNTYVSVWTAPAASSGANTVTLTSSCGAYHRSSIYELSGHDATTPYGGATGPTTNTTNPVKSGSITPTVNGSFLLSFMRNANNTYTFTPMSGWTARYSTTYYFLQDTIQTTAATINPEATASADPSTVKGLSVWINAAAGATTFFRPYFITG